MKELVYSLLSAFVLDRVLEALKCAQVSLQCIFERWHGKFRQRWLLWKGVVSHALPFDVILQSTTKGSDEGVEEEPGEEGQDIGGQPAGGGRHRS